MYRRLLKNVQRRGAREIDPSTALRTGWRRTEPVRWSEAIERNEAYEHFSAVCYCLSSFVSSSLNSNPLSSPCK